MRVKKSESVVVVLYCEDQSRVPEIQFLGYQYTYLPENSVERAKTSWRFPTFTTWQDDHIKDVVFRTIREKVCDIDLVGQLAILDHRNRRGESVSIRQPVATIVDYGDEGGIHLKHIFLGRVSKEDLPLRKEVIRIPGRPGVPTKILGIPTWIEPEKFYRLMQVAGIHPHRAALMLGVYTLSEVVGVEIGSEGKALLSESLKSGQTYQDLVDELNNLQLCKSKDPDMFDHVVGKFI